MNDKNSTYAGHVVPLWQNDPETRKRIRQLQDRLQEFKEQIQNAHAAILEVTSDEYFDRQKAFFNGSIGAIDHVQAVLNFARQGVVAVPDGWQKRPQTHS